MTKFEAIQVINHAGAWARSLARYSLLPDDDMRPVGDDVEELGWLERGLGRELTDRDLLLWDMAFRAVAERVEGS